MQKGTTNAGLPQIGLKHIMARFLGQHIRGAAADGRSNPQLVDGGPQVA